VINLTNGALAQAGFAIEPDLTSVNPHYFFGYVTSTGAYYETAATTGPATGSNIQYKVKKVNGYWAGYYGTTLIDSTNSTVAPTGVQYFNENDSTTVKYIGTSTSKLKFASVQYWDGSASASDTTTWVWKKPSLTPDNDANSAIDWTAWSSNSSWYSWDTR
jgi:hypothetical protein